jgi:hypothetical protein
MELSDSERKKIVGDKGYSEGGDREAKEEKEDDGQEALLHAKALIEAVHAKDPRAVAKAHKHLTEASADIEDDDEGE